MLAKCGGESYGGPVTRRLERSLRSFGARSGGRLCHDIGGGVAVEATS